MRRLDPVTNSLAGTVKGQITPRPSTQTNLWNVWEVAPPMTPLGVKAGIP
jgi:hypothetical protein